jgi:hypothetical protein
LLLVVSAYFACSALRLRVLLWIVVLLPPAQWPVRAAGPLRYTAWWSTDSASVDFVLMRRMQDLGASPFLQSVTMIVTALSLGWLLTRFVDCPAHQGLMSFYDQATSTRRVRRNSPWVV